MKRTWIIALLLVVSLLTATIGGTIAWFTDSVESTSNKIESGNLDIEVQYKTPKMNDWADLTPETEVFDKNALWEPGHTQAVALKVINKGNLAVKYEAGVNIISETEGTNVYGETFKLSDYLEVWNSAIVESGSLGAFLTDVCLDNRDYLINNTQSNKGAFGEALVQGNTTMDPHPILSVKDQAHEVVLVITMPTTVGNEANHKTGTTAPSITFGLNVVATQAVHESDAFDNQYDAEAAFPSAADVWDGTADTAWYNETDTAFTLSTAEELAGFAKLANEGTSFSGKTIVLDSDMDLDSKQWTPIAKFAGTLDGNDHTIGNFSVDATAAHGGFIDVMEWATVKDLTLTNVTATVGDYRFGALARSINQSNIDNVTVKDVNVTTTAPGAFVAGVFAHGTVNSNMEVNNCTVENLTINAEAGACLIGGITTFVQKNGTEAEGTNIFENLNVKNFKVIVNDTDGVCGVGGLVGQTQTVWQNPRFNNCSVSGLDVTATGMVDVGGFMCYPGSWTYAENCTAEGKIDVSGVTSADNFAGGFFADYGWGDNVGKGDHKVTSCSADVDIITEFASAGGFVGSGTNSEGRNKDITLTNCEAKGTVTLAAGGAANIGGFAGETDRGIYVNCSAAQEPFIGKVLDGYTLVDDGNGTLTVTK